MSDEAGTAVDGTSEQGQQDGNTSGATSAANDGPKLPTSQEELNRIIADRVARERAKFKDYGDLKSKASKLDEIEQAQKTELQRIQERSEAAERRAAELERDLVRSQIAIAKKLPAELASRLRGDTPDELEADADKLLALVKASTTLKPDLTQGSHGGSAVTADPAQQFADLILKARGQSR